MYKHIFEQFNDVYISIHYFCVELLLKGCVGRNCLRFRVIVGGKIEKSHGMDLGNGKRFYCCKEIHHS